MPQMREIEGPEVMPFDALQLGPESLTRVEFGGIGWQTLQVQPHHGGGAAVSPECPPETVGFGALVSHGGRRISCSSGDRRGAPGDGRRGRASAPSGRARVIHGLTAKASAI